MKLEGYLTVLYGDYLNDNKILSKIDKYSDYYLFLVDNQENRLFQEERLYYLEKVKDKDVLFHYPLYLKLYQLYQILKQHFEIFEKYENIIFISSDYVIDNYLLFYFKIVENKTDLILPEKFIDEKMPMLSFFQIKKIYLKDLLEALQNFFDFKSSTFLVSKNPLFLYNNNQSIILIMILLKIVKEKVHYLSPISYEFISNNLYKISFENQKKSHNLNLTQTSLFN